MNHNLFRSLVVLYCAMAATACVSETASDDVDVDVAVEIPNVGIEATDTFMKLEGIVGEPTAPRTSVFR